MFPDPERDTKYWIGVASADHVAHGRAEGFMQVCHGKAGPLRRISGGDGVIYYSPTQTMGGKDGLQSFTAIGTALPRAPYADDMGDGFVPFRRDVMWAQSQNTPIRPMLEQLDLTRGQRNWGYTFRFGLVEICVADFALIRSRMVAGCIPPPTACGKEC